MAYRMPALDGGYLFSFAALTGAGLALAISRAALPMTTAAFVCLSGLVAAAIFRELIKKDMDVFNPVFFISFLFFYYALLPVFDRLVLFKLYPGDALLYNSGLFFMDLGPEDDYLVFKAVSICIAGVLMFYAGYYSGGAKAVVNTCRLAICSRTASLRDMALLYLLIGAAITVFIVKEAGGPAAFTSTHWAKRFTGEGNIINNLGFLQRLALSVGTVSLLVYASVKKSKAFWGLWFLTAAAAISFFILEGGRRVVVELIISVLVVWHYKIRKIPVKTVAAAALLLFLLVPLLDVFRSNLWLGTDRMAAIFEDTNKFQLLRVNTEFNGSFDVLVNLVSRVPADDDYVYGVSFIKPFFSIIPRSIWPDKPLPISQLVAKKLYPGEEGLSVGATTIGEAYLNLGVPAVVLTMFLFGVAARAVYLYFIKGRDNDGAILIYACLFPMLFEFYRGTVSDALLMTGIQVIFLSPLIRVVRGPRAAGECI